MASEGWEFTVVEFAGLSDIGRVRAKNEDSYCLVPLEDGGLLVAVADGLGGYVGGEVASAIAVDTLRELVRSGRESLKDLKDAVSEAHHRVRQRAVRDPEVAGMATTLTTLVLPSDAHRCVWAHVGDSRAYLWRQGNLSMLTHDHSVTGELVADGVIAMDEARFHPQRNLLTRALGIPGDLAVESGSLGIESGDWLVLATDGLTMVLEDAELTGAVAADLAPQELCARLISVVNERGGPDNVTVVAVRTGERGRPREGRQRA